MSAEKQQKPSKRKATKPQGKKSTKSSRRANGRRSGKNAEILKLQAKADQARQAHDHSEAIEVYTRALDLGRQQEGGLDPATEYDLLSGRARCYEYLGDLSEIDDLKAMAGLAKAMGDLSRRIEAVDRQIEPRAQIGESKDMVEAAAELEALARKSDDKKVRAEGVYVLGNAYSNDENLTDSHRLFAEGLELFVELGDRPGEAKCTYQLGNVVAYEGQPEAAREMLNRALALQRALGDRKWESRTLSALSIFTPDQAAKRDLGEASLQISLDINDLVGQSREFNNLGLLYGHLGLYDTALKLLDRAVASAKARGAKGRFATFLESQARTLLDLGKIEEAEQAFQEVVRDAAEVKSRFLGAYGSLGLGQVEMAKARPKASLNHFKAAYQNFNDLNTIVEAATSKAFIGLAHLALNHRRAAQKVSLEAVALMEAAGDSSGDYPPQLVWWHRYKVLRGIAAEEEKKGKKASRSSAKPKHSRADEVWEALQRAHDITLDGIDKLSDKGLRRNYLNKVKVNREIVLEWTEAAMARGVTPDQEIAREGNLQDQLKRMLAIGLKLNERRDEGELTEFIMEQFVELSGAERSALILTDGSDHRKLAAARGFDEEKADTLVEHLRGVLDESFASQRATLKQDVLPGNPSKPASGKLEAASVVCVPLITHGQLVGILYGDNQAVFGRFDAADVDLLSAFANQAAAAVENAHLYQGLEDRVAERTAELHEANIHLEQRAAELAVINSVQEGLASKLDFQAIIELVGQKIMEVFESQGVGIRIYDPETDLVHYPFEVENGERLPPYPPVKAAGASGHIIHTRKPLMLNADLDQWLEQHAATVLPGSQLNKSVLGVPVIVKDQVRGLVILESENENTYTEADQRLLSTIAASMGVALENARLFDETSRLLEETRQRNAELAVINKVQEGLASKLDLEGIVDVVGDEVAKILGSGDLAIALVNESANEVVIPYLLEHGQRYTAEPGPLDETSFAHRAWQSRKPLVATRADHEANASKGGDPIGDLDTPFPASTLYVPLLSGKRALGVLFVSDPDREDAFGEAEINLVSTLANSMSVALENARLFEETNRLLEETRQRNAELAVINSVQEGLASKLNLAGVVEVVGEEIAKIFIGHDVKISLMSEDGSNLITPYLLEHGERFPVDSFPIDTATVSGRVLRSRKPLVLGPADFGEALSNGITLIGDLDSPFPKSELRVPILSGDNALGVIALGHREREDAYGESEINLLTTLANSMSVALENARLFDETNRLLEETRQRNAELAVINSVGKGLAEKLEFQSVINLVGDRVRQIFEANTTYIAVYDPVAEWISFSYYVENGVNLLESAAPLGLSRGQGLTGEVLETRQPLRLGTMEEQAAHSGVAVIRPGRAKDLNKSYLAVPIFNGDRATGVISVQKYAEHAFDEGDERLLSTLSSSMSVALENARLFEETNRLLDETRQRNAEMGVINSIQQGLASKLDMQAIFDLVGEKIREIFDAKIVDILTYDESTGLCTYRYNIEHGERLEIEPFAPRGFSGHILKTRQPLMFNEDIEARMAEYGSRVHGGGPPGAYLGVPIIRSDGAFGVISLQSYKEHAFSDSDLRLLTTLASSMSVALENARLFDETSRLLDETQHRAIELTAISTVSQALVAESDLDRILNLVGEQVQGIFDADIAYVAVHDTVGDMITFPYMYGEDNVESIPFGSGLTSEIIRSGEPLLINRDIDKAAAQLKTERAGRKAASYLGVPIFVGGQAIGVVSVQSTTMEDRFDATDVRLLSTIAANAGAAIGSAQLYEETKQRASELAAINVIGEGLLSQMDVDRVVELVGESISQIFDSEQIGIALCDYEANKIHIPYFLIHGERFPSYDMEMGEGLASVVVNTRQPLRLNNWEELRQQGAVVHPNFKDPLPEENSWLGVPIMSGAEVSGVIFSNANRSNAFNEADQRLLSTIAANMGVAIRNAQLHGETQRRAEEMEALNEIGREATATLDLPTVLQRISGNARKILGANTTSVILLDQDGESLRPISADGSMADEVMAFTWKLGEGLVGGIVESGQAERINDVVSDPRMIELPGTQKSVEGEKLLVAPLISRDTAIGAIAAWRGVEDPAFLPEDLKFVAGLAQQATIAIQNARLFEETQREKQYSEGLVLNSPVAIITTDLEANVVSWNPAAERLFGYATDEAIGRNLDGLIATGDIYTEAAGYTEKVWEEGRVNAVTQRARKDGSLVDVELLALPVIVEGVNTGLIAIYHDITDLLAAQREAEAANEAKSAFLATMSHEIRTPMNAVIGMSGLLLDTELDPEQHEFAEIIRNSGDALLGIINDVLDFSKIEAGKMELEYQPFDLRECIEGTLDLVATRAFDKGLDLAYVIDDGIPAGIVGDVTRLRQILLNLLTNAVKFTEKGEVVLRVSEGDGSTPTAEDSQDLPGDQVLHFTVRDTGIGIPLERMDRLFQSFSQVDASTARKYGGTGLGLAISKRLSEMMGGTMWVESEKDIGTTFHFAIRTEPSEAITPASRRIENADQVLQGRRVLIVDDNDTNRRILTVQAKGWAMIPRDTASPRTALKWIRKGDPFDVAILDMHMPEMDGLMLASEIRQDRAADALPLILFTSLGRRETGADELGFAAFLTKPIKPSQLYDALVSIFADQPVAARRPPSPPQKLDPGMAKRHPLRILLAEDNAVNQKLATRLLAQMGYRADVAANGLEAVESLERQTYDIVLMDVQMPEMDGLEASRQINKRWPREQRPQIVAMTANAMQGDRELCIAAGMDDYITKPIRVEELVAALDRVPSGRSQEKHDQPHD